ncbi:amino acid ABC transporter permease [Rhizobium halophytocola]|uniref:Polar amino acid transport system permease protein n=1 Tax=Rhizobium halophytocola TaxID=735519 RepID=A0ABS4DUK1_9HYPH|nr:amino acid ABC transporter permease [Rhizobium halophytocola]MBP1849368.1 polar amino acid transport system permease protein [Rhizobium halophytocola]
MGYDFDWAVIIRFFPRFLPAIWLTIEVFVLAQLLSLAIALVFSVSANAARNPLFRRATALYSWIFRGLPELVVLMFCFLALPKLGISLSPVQAAVIGLALIASAYEFEVLRGAFTAVSRHQSEAAWALGLSKWNSYRHVILPQVMRVALPPLLTFACTSLKRTSVASAVAVVEIMGMAKRLIDVLQKPFELMLIAMISYIVLSSIIMALEHTVRRRYVIPGRTGAR